MTAAALMRRRMAEMTAKSRGKAGRKAYPTLAETQADPARRTALRQLRKEFSKEVRHGESEYYPAWQAEWPDS